MAGGLAVLATSLYYMAGFDTGVTFGHLMWARMIQCAGLPFFFIPLNTIAYGNLPPGKSNSASSMMNLMRNLGGGIGISIASTLLVRRAQVHQVYLAGHVTSSNQTLVQHFSSLGGFTQRNIVSIYNVVATQATMLSYLDVFRILTVTCLVVLGLVLCLRRVNLSKPVTHVH